MEQSQYEDLIEDMYQHLKREGCLGSDRYGGQPIGLDDATDAQYRKKAKMLVDANLRQRRKRGEVI